MFKMGMREVQELRSKWWSGRNDGHHQGLYTLRISASIPTQPMHVSPRHDAVKWKFGFTLCPLLDLCWEDASISTSGTKFGMGKREFGMGKPWDWHKIHGYPVLWSSPKITHGCEITIIPMRYVLTLELIPATFFDTNGTCPVES